MLFIGIYSFIASALAIEAVYIKKQILGEKNIGKDAWGSVSKTLGKISWLTEIIKLPTENPY